MQIHMNKYEFWSLDTNIPHISLKHCKYMFILIFCILTLHLIFISSVMLFEDC